MPCSATSLPPTHSALVVAIPRGCNRWYRSLHVLLAAGAGAGGAVSAVGRPPQMQAPKGVLCEATPTVLPLLQRVRTGAPPESRPPSHAPAGHTLWTGSATVLVRHS